jgi:hypothetical protein
MATPTTLPATFVSGNVLEASQLNALRGAFRVLQVNSTTLSTTFTTASTSYTDITGLSVSITPSFTSSKILVFANLMGSQDFGINDGGYVRAVRDSTAIAVGDASGTHVQVSTSFEVGFGSFMSSASINYLDSPATTSALTYKIQLVNSSAGTSYINRTKTDSATAPRAASTITVMEISA